MYGWGSKKSEQWVENESLLKAVFIDSDLEWLGDNTPGRSVG